MCAADSRARSMPMNSPGGYLIHSQPSPCLLDEQSGHGRCLTGNAGGPWLGGGPNPRSKSIASNGEPRCVLKSLSHLAYAVATAWSSGWDRKRRRQNIGDLLARVSPMMTWEAGLGGRGPEICGVPATDGRCHSSHVTDRRLEDCFRRRLSPIAITGHSRLSR